ncbi:FG-GAP-like repeat-containing protein [Kitasatospora sp. NPDC088346]|uniref:C40 family peptidase n=1 Tax=Kitasatospora sp. NPDC088346 TaxID=3364073 RepID=UPI00381F9EE2
MSSKVSKVVRLALAASIAASGAIATTAFTATAAHASSSSVDGQITRSEIIARAQYWLGKSIPYNQGGSYADSSGRNYRTDCSGYVSMAWHLGASPNTQGLPGYSYEISRADLKAGDILNSYNDHVILFDQWDDAAHTKFSYYSFGSTPVKHVTGISINAATFDSHPNGDYKALRYNKVVDDSPVGSLSRVDFNGDGRTDIAGKLSDGQLLMWSGNGNGTVNGNAGNAMFAGTGFGAVSDMVAADFNGDGKTDVAGKLSDGELLMWAGNGDGTVSGSGYAMWPGTGFGAVSGLLAGDFNGDGKADIVGKLSDGQLLMWSGNGNGTVNGNAGNAMFAGTGFGAVSDMVAADFNNDGKVDVAGKLSDGQLLMWAGNGNGTVSGSGYAMFAGTGFGAVSDLVAGDFNSDGKADIAGKLSDGQLLQWAGNGNGTVSGSGYAMWPGTGFAAVNGLI